MTKSTDVKGEGLDGGLKPKSDIIQPKESCLQVRGMKDQDTMRNERGGRISSKFQRIKQIHMRTLSDL